MRRICRFTGVIRPPYLKRGGMTEWPELNPEFELFCRRPFSEDDLHCHRKEDFVFRINGLRRNDDPVPSAVDIVWPTGSEEMATHTGRLESCGAIWKVSVEGSTLMLTFRYWLRRWTLKLGLQTAIVTGIGIATKGQWHLISSEQLSL